MSYEETQDPTQSPDSAPGMDPGHDDGSPEFDPNFVDGGAAPVNRGPIVLGGLLVVLAGVIWFMFFRGSPQAAQAGPAAAQASDQIKEFLDQSNISLMKQTLKDTQKIVQQFQSYKPEKTQVPLASLRTNPFRELPPKADTGPVVKDDDKDLEFHKQASQAVSELHLQMISFGKHHGCMINNTFYKEGQSIGILTIDKITPATVILSAGKYRYELPMQK